MTKWKLVPVEPTPEMYRTSREVTESEGIVTTTWLRSAVYRAMLEAAPQPQMLSDERIYQVWGEQAEKTIGKSHSEFLVSFVRAIEREILGGES